MMETVRSEKIVAELDKLAFGYWDDEGGDFVTDAAEVKAYLGLSDRAYDSIDIFVSDIKQYVGEDLSDIWKRLEQLDRKVHE